MVLTNKWWFGGGIEMKYLVIGVGGTGGAVGSHLARAGHDVTFIARGRHLEAMREKGLRVIRPDCEFTIDPVSACTEAEYIESVIESDNHPDVIFVCVKGYSVDSVIPFIRAVAAPETVVIPILNIFGTGAEMQKDLPEITVTDGCIYVASEIREPGVIWMNGTILRVVFGLRTDQREQLVIEKGDLLPGQMVSAMSVMRRAEKDLNDSGIKGLLSSNIERDALHKFSYVSPQGACGLYYGVPAGALQKPGEIRDCFAGLIAEIAALADAMGFGFDSDVVSENLKIIDGLSPDMTTSLQRDVAAGKVSEIDGLIYNVVRLAREYGLELPLYEKITAELERRNIK